jgi:hypothetical protein
MRENKEFRAEVVVEMPSVKVATLDLDKKFACMYLANNSSLCTSNHYNWWVVMISLTTGLTAD